MNDLIKKAFPFVENMQINKKIKGKIHCIENKEVELEYMKKYKDLSIEQLKNFYNDTFKIKNKLEDKAKMNVVSLTISISLILGLSDLIAKVNKNIGIDWLNIIMVIFPILSIGYMVTASILSISVLIKENAIHVIFPEDLILEEEELKKVYAESTELNVKRNTIRNNYIYTSYECIINALVCLTVIFFLSVLPINGINNGEDRSSAYIGYKIIYSENFMDYCNEIDEHILKEKVADTINRSVDYIKKFEDAYEIKIADEKHKLYIKFVKVKDRIIILNVQDQICIQKKT